MFSTCIDNIVNRIAFSNFNKSSNLSPDILLLSYASSDISDYSIYSKAINGYFAEQHSYHVDFIDLSVPLKYSLYNKSLDIDSRWYKIKMLIDAIEYSKTMDYFVWMDADEIILDFNFTFESIITEYKHASIIVSAESLGSSTLINSGTIIVKNNEFSKEFLGKWWSSSDMRRFYSDQEQFDIIYNEYLHSNRAQLQSHIVILPSDRINTNPPAMTNQLPSHQFLHLMGEHNNYRKEIFREGFETICRSKSQNMSIPPQLGLTQTRLLSKTIEIYSDLVIQSLDQYKKALLSRLNSLSRSRVLLNNIHHYCHAIEYLSKTSITNQSNLLESFTNALIYIEPTVIISNHDEIVYQLRKLVYDLLLFNVQQLLKYRYDQDDILEHMKMTALAGQHLLRYGTQEDRRKVANEVRIILNDILSQCHSLQKVSVYTMITQHLIEMGRIELSDNQIDTAIKYFNESLIFGQIVAKSFGDHVLIVSLSYLANSLAIDKNFDQSYYYYDVLISLLENHINMHDNLIVSMKGSIALHYLNYGIALYENKRYVHALNMLEKSISHFDEENRDSSSHYKRAIDYKLMIQTSINV